MCAVDGAGLAIAPLKKGHNIGRCIGEQTWATTGTAMVDKILEKLLTESAVVIVMGVVIYGQYLQHRDQVQYNREQDKMITETLSKLLPVVDALKSTIDSTNLGLDRNLERLTDGNNRVLSQIEILAAAVDNLRSTVAQFLSRKGGD
jgi:hypothetical protein